MARVGLGNAVTTLSAVTSTGAGSAVDAGNASQSVWQITSASVTTGGTVLVQGSLDGTNWYTLSTTAVSTNTTTGVVVSSTHTYLRANVSARTDGTYTVKYALLIDGA